MLNAELKSMNSNLTYVSVLSRCVRAGWRAVAMASSVERLDLYANWKGSREGGRTDLMCCMQGRRYGFWAPWTAYSLGPSCVPGGVLYNTEIAIAFPSQSFFSPSPKSDYTVSAIKSFSFVCNGKVIIFRFVFYKVNLEKRLEHFFVRKIRFFFLKVTTKRPAADSELIIAMFDQFSLLKSSRLA